MSKNKIKNININITLLVTLTLLTAVNLLVLLFNIYTINYKKAQKDNVQTELDATITDTTPLDALIYNAIETDTIEVNSDLVVVDMKHFMYSMSLDKPEHITNKEEEYKDMAIAKQAEVDSYIASFHQPIYTEPTNTTYSSSNETYTQPTGDSVLTASKGVNYYGNQKETYYNLNMNGVINIAKSQGIEGEYWVREDGVKMYGDYVIVAANLNTHPRGTTVETSLGTGIVLDTGGFAESNPNQVDIATDW